MEIPQLPTAPVDLAVWWANQGWLVFPCKETDKAPYTANGFKNGMTDEAAIRSAWAKHPKALVGGATGKFRSVVDLDCKPGEIDGRAVWTAVAHVDAEPIWTSVTPSGGVHRVYNKIENHPSIGQYPWFGFDIRNEGGYIILPGSVMADGRRYELTAWGGDRAASVIDWEKIDRVLKEENETTRVLWAWHLVKEKEKKEARDKASRERRGVLAAAPVTTPVRVGKLEAPLPPEGAGKKAESPEAWARIMELVAELNDCPDGLGHREISRICFEAGSRIVRHGQADVDQVIEAFQSGLTWLYRNDGDERKVFADIDRCVRDGVLRGTGEPWRSGGRTTTAPPPPPANPPAAPGHTAPPAQAVAPVALSGAEVVPSVHGVLPPEFFQGSSVLEHIRDEAYRKGRSATTTTFATLALIASMADKRLRIPGFVGADQPLSLYVCAVAPSGGGKSTGTNLAKRLVNWDESRPDGAETSFIMSQPSTGQGMIEQHFALTPDPDAKGRNIKEQVAHNAFWSYDEGQTLINHLKEKGSILGYVLRSGWNGEHQAQANANPDLRRDLPAMSYQWGFMVVIQEAFVDDLINETDGGTAQRFIWCSTEDPGVPLWRDRDWRDKSVKSLGWVHPQIPRSALSSPGGEDTPFYIDFPEWFIEEMMDWDDGKRTGSIKVEPLDSHLYLSMMKFAGTLALAHGRLHVTDEDIHRVKMAFDAVSRPVARRLVRSIKVEAAKKEQAAAVKRVEAEEAANTAREDKVREIVTRKANEAGPDGIVWSKLTTHTARYRKALGDERYVDIVSGLEADGKIRRIRTTTDGNPVYGPTI